MKPVEQLHKIREAINTRTITPDELSRAVVSLHSLLCTIGEEVANLKKAYELAYWERKRQWTYYKHLAEGDATAREKQANESINELKLKEVEAEYAYNYLKNIRDDYSQYAMGLQSRLNVLRDERIKTYKE